MGDSGVGQHALDVGLGDGNEVADRQRDDGEDHQHPLPIGVELTQTIDQKTEGQGKGRDLGGAAQEQDHRVGCPLVGIGHPHMERNGTELKADTNDDEDQTEDQDLIIRPLPGHRPGHGPQFQGAGGAIEHGEAVEEQARTQCTQHEIFHGRLGPARAVAVEGHQGIERQGQEFQAEVER